MISVPVQAICNTILLKSFEENINVTPMKLQKLLYFIYKDYLQRTGNQLFTERFETWQYGPVLSSVYAEFCSFRASRITKLAKNADGSAIFISDDGAPDIMRSINAVWNKYKGMNGIQLSNITHSEGSAWYKAFKNEKAFLDNEDIKGDHVG